MIKNLPANAKRLRRHGFDPWVKKNPWRRKWQPTPIFLPGESLGQRNLDYIAGYRPYCGLQIIGSQRVRRDCVTEHP